MSTNVCSQVSAGNQLFHMVVDNDEIATKITGLLAKEKAGRVTFIPLNRHTLHLIASLYMSSLHLCLY